MMKKIVFLLVFASPTAFATPQEYSLSDSHPLLIRVVVKDTQSESLPLIVEEKTTKKAVVLNLNLLPSKTGYGGIYRIDFSNAPAEPTYEFHLRSNDAKNLFIFSEKTPKYQRLTLFETDEQATAYAKAHPTPEPSKTVTKSAGAEPKTLKNQKAEQEAAKKASEQVQAQERMNLELEEAVRREKMLKDQEKLSQAEQKNRADRALVMINQASDFYGKGQYQQSADLYSKAIDLDPSHDEIYYRYGVSLYKIDQYNKSLAVLSVGENGVQNKAEYNYFLGMNHMKLKENDKAIDKFHASREDNDKEISPMAAFLEGSLEFQDKKYPESKESFEYVLDNSKDPQLDNQAEGMIEEINRIENFLNSAKEKIRYTFSGGVSYDGNVLNIAKQNLATDDAAYRLAYSTTFLYKFFQAYKSELGLQASYSDLYSTNTNFAADTSIQAADPLVMAVSLPYQFQFQGLGHAYMAHLTPSYSTLTMNPDGTVRRKIIQSSTLDSDVGYQPSPTWYSVYRIQLNQDTSALDAISVDDDQTALRTTFGTTQTYYLDPRALRTLGADLSYAINTAKGKNNSYQKTILGVTYTFPAMGLQASLRPEYTTQNFPDNPNGRSDNLISLSVAGSKSLTKTLSLAR
jgi:tetratricopeptide (TPR) repeat protein